MTDSTFPAPPNMPLQSVNWPAHFPEDINRAFQHSWSSETRKHYKSSIEKYLAFCRKNNIHVSLVFPANEYLLCAFVADLLNSFSTSSIKNILSGLRAWHISNQTSFPRHDSVSTLARTVIHSRSQTRPLRKPVTTQMLIQLANHLRLYDHKDVCILATALTAFWTLARLGELLPGTFAHDADKFPSLSAAVFDSESNTTIRIPWSKTTKWQGATLLCSPQLNPINPISALRVHIQFNHLTESDRLFSYWDQLNKKNVILYKSEFLTRCNEIWSSYDIPRTSGHSFRIGGASHLLSVGIHPDIVRTIGRWSSDSFLRYWRNHSIIVPNHVRFLPLGASRGQPLAAASALAVGDPPVSRGTPPAPRAASLPAGGSRYPGRHPLR